MRKRDMAVRVPSVDNRLPILGAFAGYGLLHIGEWTTACHLLACCLAAVLRDAGY